MDLGQDLVLPLLVLDWADTRAWDLANSTSPVILLSLNPWTRKTCLLCCILVYIGLYYLCPYHWTLQLALSQLMCFVWMYFLLFVGNYLTWPWAVEKVGFWPSGAFDIFDVIFVNGNCNLCYSVCPELLCGMAEISATAVWTISDKCRVSSVCFLQKGSTCKYHTRCGTIGFLKKGYYFWYPCPFPWHSAS